MASYDVTLKQMAMSLAELDVASSLALLAINRGFVKPKIVDGTEFEVKGGRHPVVDIMQPDSFVNNDCILTEKNLWVVTGPNMGGKVSEATHLCQIIYSLCFWFQFFQSFCIHRVCTVLESP